MDSLIYEDKPHYDIWLKLIIAFPLVFILIGAVNLVNDREEAIGMFVTAVLIAVIYWAVFPRKYCILDSKVKIVLGGPFSINIPLDTIETTRTPKGMALGINFATSLSGKNAIQIVRKGKMNVNITPSDRELFVKNLDTTLDSWRGNNTRNR